MDSSRADFEVIRHLMQMRDFRQLRRIFREHELADIAESFTELTLPECIALYRLVPRPRRAELFAHLPFDRQEDLLENLPDIIVAALVNEMEADDRTRLLEDLTDDIRVKLIAALDPQERKISLELLSYPEYSVGRLMTPDFVAISSNMKVREALEFVRWNTSLPSEYLHVLFVIDEQARLIGEMTLAALVTCDPPSLLVSEVMHRTYVALLPEEEGREAIEMFRKYDRNVIPVVDQDKRILGLISADDVFDLAEEEATEEIQQFGGQGPLEDSYMNTPFLTMLRKRAGWLSFLFVSGFLSGHVIRTYEDTMLQWSFLVFFLPIITSAGGNSGTQAAALIIRAIAISEISSKDISKIFRKELILGVTLGLNLGAIGFGLALCWGLSAKVGLIVLVSMVTVVIFGVLAGSMLPFLVRKIRLDPAVVSSPFISTLVDATGVMILFNVALLVIKYCGAP